MEEVTSHGCQHYAGELFDVDNVPELLGRISNCLSSPNLAERELALIGERVFARMMSSPVADLGWLFEQAGVHALAGWMHILLTRRSPNSSDNAGHR
jgi:hypothetical protein